MAARNNLMQSRDGAWQEAEGSAQIESVAGMAKVVDTTDATVYYKGWADVGVATSAASWRIQRISISGGVYSFDFADGDAEFDNVWDNRASLSYS